MRSVIKKTRIEKVKKPGTLNVWVEVGRSEGYMDEQEYNEFIDVAGSGLGGSCRQERGFTYDGYRVVRDVRTSPDGESQTETLFDFGEVIYDPPEKLFDSVEEIYGWKVGENYFVRTVTHHFTGKLERVTDKELWFSSVAWIADDGRYSTALKEGELAEVEPMPFDPVAIGRGSLIDASPWRHPLPRDVK